MASVDEGESGEEAESLDACFQSARADSIASSRSDSWPPSALMHCHIVLRVGQTVCDSLGLCHEP